jgi:hypothetical protein
MILIKKIRYKDPLQAVLLILTIFMTSGCQKVINVDLNEAAPRIVIEGLITDRNGPFAVTISKSGSFFNQTVLPPVSGAEVIIADDAGTIDTLKEITTGVYLTSKTRGIPGRTYTLKVLSENKEYTGSSTMHDHVSIDLLILIKSQSQHIGFDGGNTNEIHVDVHCFFKDPGEKNFYRVKVFRNDTTRAENYRLYDDQYTNGQETDLRVSQANAGDTDLVELFSLDKQTYGYYRTLEDLLNTDPIFGSTPANPNTNLNNGALGYFGACAVSSKIIIITESLIKNIK